VAARPDARDRLELDLLERALGRLVERLDALRLRLARGLAG